MKKDELKEILMDLKHDNQIFYLNSRVKAY